VETAALRCGVEAEPVAATYREVEGLLAAAQPLLLRLPGDAGWLALLGGAGGVRLLGPEGATRRWSLPAAVAALRRPLEGETAPEIDHVLDQVGVAVRFRPRALALLLAERLGSRPCTEGWVLRLPAGASPLLQLRGARIPALLGALVTSHTLVGLVLVAAWAVLGRGVLSGRLDPGWQWSWVLLLASLVPFQAVRLWVQGRLALTVGALLKRRLLAGALRLEPEEVRDQGAGELLGRVIEAERVEGLALSGGFAALLAGVELALAAVVLGLGAAGWLHGMLLVVWALALALFAARQLGERRSWVQSRIEMTRRTVERLLGYRTRLAQEPRGHWHEEEDRELQGYLDRSRRLDRLMPRLEVFATRGWLLAAILALAPALLSGRASTPQVAVSLGGILLALQGFQGVVGGLLGLTGAALAGEQVAPLYRAAARPLPVGSPAVAREAGRDGEPDAPVLAARGLVFRYPGRAEAAVRNCDLVLRAGDRVLLSGPSGSGKSTLVSLLAALRRPQSGLLSLHGADLHGWGASGWHRRVIAVPQFQDNHLFAAPLAFNLLLGRGWPPSPRDLEEAALLCVELGLGDLVARMPAGLFQPVGDTGWSLSHGEASRVFLARALLQDPEVVLLDESFAALDPASLARVLGCAERRARTLLVVHHL
jgi:ATP-binding cassette subfamily B protein